MTAITTTDTVAQKTISREKPDALAGKRSVLCIRGLRKSFGGQIVLDSVSAELREGEIVLLRGNNGSGKTTLLNILSGNLEPDAGAIHFQVNGSTEHFEFPRRWLDNLNPFDHFTPERVAREGVGRTWQDVRLFNNLTLSENIAVASPRQAGEKPLNILLRHGRMRWEEQCNRQTTSKRLRGLGLSDRENSSADRISLGQSKRVAIARAVQAGARILFLDEPLAGLDAQGIDCVLELLRELVREHRVTLVIVEHVFNIPRVLDLADNVWTLQDGKISIESPQLVRKELQCCLGNNMLGWMRSSLGPEWTEENESLQGGATLTRLRNSKSGVQNPKPLLEVCNLIVRRGKRLVIGRECSDGSTMGISFTLFEGDLAIFQAPNGWGKTTLLEAILGILPASSDYIRFRGQSVHDTPTWERVSLGMSVLQSQGHGFSSLTVADHFKLSRPNDHNVESSLISLSDRTASSLSGGQRQRMALASVRSGCLGLYDEPFSALDFHAFDRFPYVPNGEPFHAYLILMPQLFDSKFQ